MENLEDARKQIDDLDEKLLRLFLQRMEVSDRIAAIKMDRKLPLFQPGREDEVIRRVEASSPPSYAGYTAALFHCLMEQSKGRQRELFRNAEKDSPFDLSIRMPAHEIAHPRVLAQGTYGSYTGAAALSLYPDCQLSYVSNWEQVPFGLQDGSADYGVLPVENSSSGSVFQVYDLMLKYKFYIVKALAYQIHHCLLGVRGAKAGDVRDIYSHMYAFPQCSAFLDQHPRVRRHPYANTAMAAEYVAKTGDKSKAAIGSRENARLYGLDVLAENIQNTSGNCTRFISVSRNPEFSENANKISLVFTVPHVIGSLCRTLGQFANAGLNLTKIESRPNPAHNFEYYFYVDFTGAIRSERTHDLMAAFSRELPNFYFFGNYHEY